MKAAERALADVRAALGAMPPLPSKQDYDDGVRRLKAVQAALTPKLQELREIEGWQRWANVGIQEQLCEKMEALKAAEDPEEIARRIRELQQQWRQAADVPRAQGEALWRRFKAAHDEVWTRCEAHFAAEAERRRENLTRKIALCERAEALAVSTSWVQTAEEIKRLQAEWKTIGPVSRGQEKPIWERFRVACDRFFTRRHEDLAQRKVLWAENLAKKEALCARAEALAESTDWDAAAAELRRLQGEWRAIGPVKKSRSEAIWQRFRGACDRFFLRFAQRHEIAREERVAAREAICAELAAFAPEPDRRRPAIADRSPDAGGTDAGCGEPGAAAGPARRRPFTSRPLAAGARAARRRSRPRRRARSTFCRGVRARGRPLACRSSPAPISIPMPTGSGWRRWCCASKQSPRHSAGPPPPDADKALTPATRLAAMLKEALAANTIGGKVDDENRWRAAQEDVRQAQASWSRIGAVPEPARRALDDRFQRACRLVLDRPGGASGISGAQPAAPPSGAARPGGAGGAGGPVGPARPGGAGR